MLNLNPTSLFARPAPVEINYSSDALSVTVTGLPLHGVSLKEGGAQLRLGDKLTRTELGALSFKRAGTPLNPLAELAWSPGPLSAPASSTSGGNGVYGYGGASLFLTNRFNSSSYAVDVAFKTQFAV
jgi:hypothetical protein